MNLNQTVETIIACLEACDDSAIGAVAPEAAGILHHRRLASLARRGYLARTTGGYVVTDAGDDLLDLVCA